MFDIQAIKNSINCVAVAQRCGLPVNKAGDRTVSPLRAGAKNQSSFCVDEDFWYDFGAGRGGDCIDLWAELRCNGDRGRAIRELAQMVGVTDSRGSGDVAAWEEYTQNLCNQVAYWQTRLTEEDRHYLHGRGLTDSTIEALKFGRTEDGRLAIPYMKNGYVAYYCTRHLPGGRYPESKYRKQRKDGMCEHIAWGLDSLTREGDTLIVAEGAFDAISFWQAGYPVLSAITGNFSREQLPTLLSAAKRFKRVLIVYDNDDRTHAGEKFTERTARILLQAKIPFVVGTVPKPYHDVSDYYAAGNDLSLIVSGAQEGVTYLIQTFTEFNDLERFCLNVSRHIKRTVLEELFSTIIKSERFNDRAVKALYKSCTTAPPENIVADEIMHDHQLIYINAIGFYEYGNGVWTKQPDGVVKGYADNAYGTFSTAQRVSAVCNLLKVRALQDVDFDRQPVWNFINGTLELDSGTFREHNPNDYCSIQSLYPYNPDAQCPSWEQFINDVTAGDPRAAEILQFIPGYALFADCPHEKVFVLTGSGGNGKTRYLQALGQIFGEQNCSHVTPRGLLDKFQRIKLKDSIVNLAGEIKSDLCDAEEYIKMIASGEMQSACFKSQDFVDFIPRSKLVFACNGQLASGDTSEGLTRRLVIVDFKCRFVDRPDPNDPYQRQKNIHVFDTIQKEIDSGGVFNWVYAGYKMLKQVGYFTTTNDQEQLLHDFKRASNPVLLFYEEINPSDPELTNKQLYEDYKIWCVTNGYRALNANWFHREFKVVAAHEYQPFCSNGVRGYRRAGGVNVC